MRHLRLYAYFVQFSISKAMEFRLDFTFRILMDIFYYAVNIMFFKVIYLHTPMLAGWSEEQMMLFVSVYLVVDGLNMTIFSTNMWWLPDLINKGGLDYYLIRPISPLFFISTREFSANSFLNLVMAIGIFIYSLYQYPTPFSVWELLFFILLIINGTLLYYSCQLLMIIPVFWTQSSRGFVDLFYSLGMAMERPHKIYRGALKIVFTFILPFALIASFPATLFMDKFSWATLIQLIVVTIVFWNVVLFVWRKGLGVYSSASS